MMPPAVCLIYTQDPDLLRRVKAYVQSLGEVRSFREAARADIAIRQAGPSLLMVDLRTRDSDEVLARVQREWPEMLIVALGVLRSEPLREAERLGVYATEDVELDRRRFQALARRAFDYLRVLEENRELRNERSLVPAAPAGRLELLPGSSAGSAGILARFPRVFRHFESVDKLLTGIVETVADAAGVPRLGIFCRQRRGEPYRLRAALRCLPESRDLEYDESDPLVRWLELNGHLISRLNLDQVSDHGERSVLRRALDSFGAEVIVPLYARGEIVGWIFFGRRATGVRFENRDLEALMVLAEHVSTVLENALLNTELTLQKTLAETLLRTIPPGIVAVDEQGVIRWLNPTAEKILGLQGPELMNQPIERAGRTLSGFVREALDSQKSYPPRQWLEPSTHRSLLVEVRQLTDHEAPLGAVAVISDLTAEESLRQKQDLVERAAFWTDLAASMSHEIRNPLVAIKTFAQLLPGRFDDANFRDEFSRIVLGEVDRLDKIITQINNFAHPPDIELKPIDLHGPVERALELARERLPSAGAVDVETSLPNDLPKIMGDEEALADAVAHLVANAAEAASEQEKPRITVSAKPIREGKRARGVVLTVRDNGPGIEPELRNKVFSPFCTTKPRGMGLGLPIVKRTVFDHHGRVDIDSSSRGTLVSIMLPASPNGH